MGLDIVILVNLSSLTDQDVLSWAAVVLPDRAIKIVPLDGWPKQDSKVLIFYDSLVRRLTECFEQAGNPIDVEAEAWAKEAIKIVDLVSVNPENRICLETDATPDAQTALSDVLGAGISFAPLRSSKPEIGLPWLIAQLLVQQNKGLAKVLGQLEQSGATQSAPICLKPTELALVLDQARTLQDRVAAGDSAIMERDRWLELLRGTAWEATTRAQQAEARARDLEMRLKHAEKQALRLQSNKTPPSSEFTQILQNFETLQHQITYLEQREAHLTEENAGLRHQIIEILSSTSWRITSPVRAVRKMLSR